MKTIILYATKNGATREIAQRIADNVENAQMYDLKQPNIPSLNQFDCVIIGSSIYAGTIHKEVKRFLAQNTGLLQGKRLGLFLSGIDAAGEQRYFKRNFSQDILRMAAAYSFLGGIYDPQKAGVLGRMVMKIVAKRYAYEDNILNDRIEKFTEAVTRDKS